MIRKLATWNVNSIRAREEAVLRWLEMEAPDVLCMQETKVQDDLFPAEAFLEMGYGLSLHGQKTWNGVAVLSREEPLSVSTGLPDGFLSEQKRLIKVRLGDLTVVNVYVPNGGEVGLDRFRDKLMFLDRLRDYVRELSASGPLVVMGDFNVAPGNDDVYDPAALDGTVCFHPEERARIRDLISDGMLDVFRCFNPGGRAFSWWDYRAAAFRRGMGMRLDLVLLNGEAAGMAAGCRIDTGPRGWDRPSDHAPVVLELSTPR